LVRPSSLPYDEIINNDINQSDNDVNIISVLDENFSNWVSATPSNYPFGWIVNVSNGSNIQKTSSNQMMFNMGDLSLLNLVIVSKSISSAFGNLVIETNVSILPSLTIGVDLLTLVLWSDDEIVFSENMLSNGQGYKKYNINVSENRPITKLDIVSNSRNKTLYVDYIKMYSESINNINDGTLYEHKYNRLFEVIATPSDLNIYPVGFNKNIFNEQVYGFNFNRNFDIRNVVDGLGMPITDFYMFLQYKTSVNGNGVRETIQYINYNTDGSYFVDDLVMDNLNIGDIIKTVDNRCISDRIGYNKSEYYQEIINDQIFYIITECKRPDNNNSVNIKWKYNPFIPIKLRYLSDEVYEANTGDTSYETTSIIPNYAISIDNHGNYVWRDVFQEGFIDPLSNKGNDFPFMNGNRYVFNSIVFSIQPELKDPNTKSIFNNIWFDRDSEKIKIKPISNIKDIGKPCR